MLISGLIGHASMVQPPPRNAVDRDLSPVCPLLSCSPHFHCCLLPFSGETRDERDCVPRVPCRHVFPTPARRSALCNRVAPSRNSPHRDSLNFSGMGRLLGQRNGTTTWTPRSAPWYAQHPASLSASLLYSIPLSLSTVCGQPFGCTVVRSTIYNLPSIAFISTGQIAIPPRTFSRAFVAGWRARAGAKRSIAHRFTQPSPPPDPLQADPSLPGNLSLKQGQSCFWFSHGCTIFCPRCDGKTARAAHAGACDNEKTAVATICDPEHRTLNRQAPCGTEADTYYFNPWRAPGSAPVFDACGACA